MRLKIYLLTYILATLLFTSCKTDDNSVKIVTIYHINDVHGQIKNMAKIKYILDNQRKQNPAILVTAGDLFSGNPVIDNYKSPGLPMIDILNKTGVAISAMGNHEFDYGKKVLSERIVQSNFPWVIANADFSNTAIKGVSSYQTLDINGIKITFLGLIETEGMQNAIIPSTHPWDIKNIIFQKAQDVLPKYEDLKQKSKADLYILLSHLGDKSTMEGMIGDYRVAQEFPYFDAIIGGHTHSKIDTIINGTPILQAGSYVNYLGQIDFKITNKKVELINTKLIDLNAYPQEDKQLARTIDAYYKEMNPILDEKIGFSASNHSINEAGCFFTSALQSEMNADLCIQNTGGIRSKLNKGPITIREIYEIDPFNNGTIMYKISVGEVKKFLKESKSGFYYSGLTLTQSDDIIYISDTTGNVINDTVTIKLGMSDYTAAVHQAFFPAKGIIFNQTSSEMLINYVKNTKTPINYSGCKGYFRFE